MNVYRVTSEELETRVSAYSVDPPEIYCIAELVAAATSTKARWAAWRSDRESYTGDVRDMPRMSVRLVATGLDIPAGIVTGDPAYADAWDTVEAAR
jgi:hypothetical protein